MRQGVSVCVGDTDISESVVEHRLPLVVQLVLIHDADLLAGLPLTHLVDDLAHETKRGPSIGGPEVSDLVRT